MPRDRLRDTTVGEVRVLLGTEPRLCRRETSIDELLEDMVSGTCSRHTYVVDEAGRLVGSVRVLSIMNYLMPDLAVPSRQGGDAYLESGFFRNALKSWSLTDARAVADLMVPDPLSVRDDTTMRDVLEIMERESVDELPVVDEGGCVVGEVNLVEMVACLVRQRRAS